MWLLISLLVFSLSVVVLCLFVILSTIKEVDSKESGLSEYGFTRERDL
jgi:hypothetical protein